MRRSINVGEAFHLKDDGGEGLFRGAGGMGLGGLFYGTWGGREGNEAMRVVATQAMRDGCRSGNEGKIITVEQGGR